MKLIKAQPKYKCDFCNKTGGIRLITKHELICYKNPNRVCDVCGDSGFCDAEGAFWEVYKEYDCFACGHAYEAGGKHYFDDEQIRKIKEYENAHKDDVPF